MLIVFLICLLIGIAYLVYIKRKEREHKESTQVKIMTISAEVLLTYYGMFLTYAPLLRYEQYLASKFSNGRSLSSNRFASNGRILSNTACIYIP